MKTINGIAAILCLFTAGFYNFSRHDFQSTVILMLLAIYNLICARTT